MADSECSEVDGYFQDDLLSWLIDEAKGEDTRLDNIVMRVLFINFVIMHNTAMVSMIGDILCGFLMFEPRPCQVSCLILQLIPSI